MEAKVAPHVGAWIEILFGYALPRYYKSHPTWVRGLKFFSGSDGVISVSVAPHVGAWIEISEQSSRAGAIRCRTPRGCVD